MIKINLLKAMAGAESAASVSYSEGDERALSPAVKLAIMFAGVGLLMAYEQITVPGLKSELNGVRAQLQSLRAENQKAGNAVSEIEKIMDDIAKTEAQIVTLKDLSKNRLILIKVLDSIQENIPEKVWLTSVAVRDNTVSLSGNAVSQTEINAFSDALGRVIHFAKVNLVNSSEDSQGGAGTFWKFQFECEMEGMK